ncbi:MAG: hypothetical protein ACRD3Q_13825, partial [Terriglobales bacterium]
MRRSFTWLIPWLIAFALPPATILAQSTSDRCPGTAAGLYERIRTVGLDPARIYHVRGASVHRLSLDLTFDDGTLA